MVRPAPPTPPAGTKACSVGFVGRCGDHGTGVMDEHPHSGPWSPHLPTTRRTGYCARLGLVGGAGRTIPLGSERAGCITRS